MKEKVCIIHKSDNLDPRSFFKQAKTLRDAGYSVSVIGLQDRDRLVDGIRVIGAGRAESRFGRFSVANFRVLSRALREKASVYHFHDLDFVPWAVLLKMITGAAIIYDIHEAHPEYMMLKSYIPFFLKRLFSILVYIMEHAASKVFDAIVPNDNFIASGFRHKRKVVIFNFPSLEFFRKFKPLPFSDRQFDLVYLGSLPRYHLERMMSIAERLNLDGIRNRWAISTPDGATLPWAMAELERRGLTENFVFLPYVTYTDVAQYLSMAKIGIIPLPPFKKFMKNIPVKMFEFMGCGMPFVLSDLPPSRQFIEGSGCAAAVEPDNIEQYAKAIKTFLSDPGAAGRAGSAGKRLVSERYNWVEEEKKLLALYVDLTGDNEHGR